MPVADRQRWRREPTGVERSVFQPGPSAAHPRIPVARGWRIAGTIIGVVAAIVLLTVVLRTTDERGTQYREIQPVAIETDAADHDSIGISVQVDPDLPGEGRVRVTGDQLVEVEVSGDAICAPVIGAADAWIDVLFCGVLDRLTVVALDIDDVRTTLVARF